MNNQGVGILVVDDEFSVRDSLYNWFKTEGYRTDTAENGMEALKKLQENPWDIVLLDIKMPGIDGVELQRHIKKIDNTIKLMIRKEDFKINLLRMSKKNFFQTIREKLHWGLDVRN